MERGSEIEHIWQTAYRLGFYRGGAVFMSALAGIDIALWDLKGENPVLDAIFRGWEDVSVIVFCKLML